MIAVFDKLADFSDRSPDAVRYVAGKHARGKVAISVGT